MLRSFLRGIRAYGNRGDSSSQRPPYGWNKQPYQRGSAYSTPEFPSAPYQRSFQPSNYQSQPQSQYSRGFNQSERYSQRAPPHVAPRAPSAGSEPRFRKPVTSNCLSFQAKDGGRLRVSYDANRTPSLSLVLEEQGKKSYISYGMTQEAVNNWIENYTQSRPQTLPEAGEVTAKVGSTDDQVLVQLASRDKTLNIAITPGQAKLIEAFLKWTQE